MVLLMKNTRKNDQWLEPCVWCKKSDGLVVHQNMDLDGITFFLCHNCGAVTSFMNITNKLEAIERWNKRYGHIN